MIGEFRFVDFGRSVSVGGIRSVNFTSVDFACADYMELISLIVC